MKRNYSSPFSKRFGRNNFDKKGLSSDSFKIFDKIVIQDDSSNDDEELLLIDDTNDMEIEQKKNDHKQNVLNALNDEFRGKNSSVSNNKKLFVFDSSNSELSSENEFPDPKIKITSPVSTKPVNSNITDKNNKILNNFFKPKPKNYLFDEVPISSIDKELIEEEKNTIYMDFSSKQLHENWKVTSDSQFQSYDPEFDSPTWNMKYTPNNIKKEYVGNQKVVQDLIKWLQNHQEKKPNIKKAALLIGPSGCGKSCLAWALSRYFNMDYKEFNPYSDDIPVSNAKKKKTKEKADPETRYVNTFISQQVIPKMVTNLEYPCIVQIESADTFGNEDTFKSLYQSASTKATKYNFDMLNNPLKISKNTFSSDGEIIKTLPNGKQYYTSESNIKQYPNPLIITANEKTQNLKKLAEHCEVFYIKYPNESEIATRLEQICEQENIIPTPLYEWENSISNFGERSLKMKQYNLSSMVSIKGFELETFDDFIDNSVSKIGKSFTFHEQQQEDNHKNKKSKILYTKPTQNDNYNTKHNLKSLYENKVKTYRDMKVYDLLNMYKKHGKTANVCHLVANVCHGDVRKAINIMEICSMFYDKTTKKFNKEDVYEVVFRWTLWDDSIGEYTLEQYKNYVGDTKNDFNALQDKVHRSNNYTEHVVHTHLYHLIKYNNIHIKSQQFNELEMLCDINDLWSCGDLTDNFIRRTQNYELLFYKDVFMEVLPIFWVKSNLTLEIIPLFFGTQNKMFDATFVKVYNNAAFGAVRSQFNLKSNMNTVKKAFQRNYFPIIDEITIYDMLKYFTTYFIYKWNDLEFLQEHNKRWISASYPIPKLEYFYSNCMKILQMLRDLTFDLFQKQKNVLIMFNKKEIDQKIFDKQYQQETEFYENCIAQIKTDKFEFNKDGSKQEEQQTKKDFDVAFNIFNYFETNDSIFDVVDPLEENAFDTDNYFGKNKKPTNLLTEIIQKSNILYNELKSFLNSKDSINQDHLDYKYLIRDEIKTMMQHIVEVLDVFLFDTQKQNPDNKKGGSFVGNTNILDFEKWNVSKTLLVKTLCKLKYDYQMFYYFKESKISCFQLCMKKMKMMKNDLIQRYVVKNPGLKQRNAFELDNDGLFEMIEKDVQKSIFVLSFVIDGFDSDFFKSFMKLSFIQIGKNPLELIHHTEKMKTEFKYSQNSFFDRMLLFEKLFHEIHYDLETDSIIIPTDKYLQSLQMHKVYFKKDNDSNLMKSPFNSKKRSFTEIEKEAEKQKNKKKTKHASNKKYINSKYTSHETKDDNTFNSPVKTISLAATPKKKPLQKKTFKF